MAQPAVASPIASATSLDQIAELMAAIDLTLTPDQIARLSAAGV